MKSKETLDKSVYGKSVTGIYALQLKLWKIIKRMRDCYHICIWCKYRKICELSWWNK